MPDRVCSRSTPSALTIPASGKLPCTSSWPTEVGACCVYYLPLTAPFPGQSRPNLHPSFSFSTFRPSTRSLGSEPTEPQPTSFITTEPSSIFFFQVRVQVLPFQLSRSSTDTGHLVRTAYCRLVAPDPSDCGREPCGTKQLNSNTSSECGNPLRIPLCISSPDSKTRPHR